MLAYMRGFVVLFVLLVLLTHLTPKSGYQKYVRFFAELILTIGIVSPVLSVFFDDEKFLEQIAYEEFTGNLEEITKDMGRMEYMHKDYYIEEYEKAIAVDVARMAEDYGFAVGEVKVQLSGEYTVEAIRLLLSDGGEERVVIEPIVIGEAEVESRGGETEVLYAHLVRELMEYYRMEESQIQIVKEKTSQSGTSEGDNSGREISQGGISVRNSGEGET